MAENDLLKRYLDAGMAFTALTQARAEGIVRDLVKAGEVQAEQAQKTVQDLLDRSRKNTEKLLGQVRDEVRSTVGSLGLATKADIARIEGQIAELKKAQASATRAAKARTKKTAATKSTAKQSSTKKA